MIFALPKKMCVRRRTHESVIGSPWGSIPSGSKTNVITTGLYCIFWRRSHILHEWSWVIYINNVLSIKTILFDILDFWCQLVVIRFVKTLSKRRMFVSFMKSSACWLLHRLIKICWEKRPAKPRPNQRTSFCRRDLKNTQPHLNNSFFQNRHWEVGCQPRYLMCTINSQRFKLLPQKYDILLIFYSLSRSRTSWEAGFHTWVDVYL